MIVQYYVAGCEVLIFKEIFSTFVMKVCIAELRSHRLVNVYKKTVIRSALVSWEEFILTPTY